MMIDAMSKGAAPAPLLPLADQRVDIGSDEQARNEHSDDRYQPRSKAERKRQGEDAAYVGYVAKGEID